MPSRRAIIFGGLGLAALGAAAFFLLEPDPQTALRKAQRKLTLEKTMRLDVEGALAMPPRDLGGAVVPSATGVEIAMRVDLDRTDPADPSLNATFEFTQGEGDAAVKLAGEARRKDGRHYLKLESAGDLEPDAAERLLGKWVTSDRSFLEFIVPPDERAMAERPLDGAGWQAMHEAIANVDLFTVTQKLPETRLGEARARRYEVDLNMQAVSALLMKLRELRTGTPIGAEDVLAVTAEIVRWGQPHGEIWIDRRSGKFLKIVLIGELEGAAVGGAVTFSRYGEPVVVEVPAAEDLEKVLGPIFSKRLSLAGGREGAAATGEPSEPPAAPGAEAQAADSDGDGLSDGQEFFYGADAWNPDTDADGWKDGLEVDKGMDPVGPGPLFGFGL